VINRGGPPCVVRLIDETDADVATIAMAYVAVDESYSLHRLNDAIDALDNKIDGQLQLGLYAAVRICCTPAWSGMCAMSISAPVWKP